MKKNLIIWFLLLGTIVLTGCSDSDVQDPEIINNDESVHVEEDENYEYEGGGERSTVITDMCGDEGGKIEDDMCLYPDGTFCYLDDMTVNECYRGLMKYGVDNIEND